MIIKSAEFIKSAVKPAHYPPEDRPEIAFAGRSNVGKSSLINKLVNRRRLVKTSSTPGRTQHINFFSINRSLSLVDLPGYGYARVPAAVRKQWGPMVENYFKHRKCLRGVVIILDIRRTPGDLDRDLMRWVAAFDIPTAVVLTKADKLSKNKQKPRLGIAAGAMDLAIDDLILFSAKNGLGKTDVWRRIMQWIPELNPERIDS